MTEVVNALFRFVGTTVILASLTLTRAFCRMRLSVDGRHGS